MFSDRCQSLFCFALNTNVDWLKYSEIGDNLNAPKRRPVLLFPTKIRGTPNSTIIYHEQSHICRASPALFVVHIIMLDVCFSCETIWNTRHSRLSRRDLWVTLSILLTPIYYATPVVYLLPNTYIPTMLSQQIHVLLTAYAGAIQEWQDMAYYAAVYSQLARSVMIIGTFNIQPQVGSPLIQSVHVWLRFVRPKTAY